MAAPPNAAEREYFLDPIVLPIPSSNQVAFLSGMTLHLRIADPGCERNILATIARAVREADPRLPIVRVETWREPARRVDKQHSEQRD